ncbi:MAG: hypothetical protein CMQ20_17560 [Gammaproteobacteria bacterium]|nr:hypothetical protein [Gammaproteobacteria bacterium]
MLFASLNSLFRSVSFRITSAFMLIFIVATIAIVGFTYKAMERYLEQQANLFLEGLILDNMDFAQEFGSAALIAEINEISSLDENSREIYVLFNEECVVVGGSPDRMPSGFINQRTCSDMENIEEAYAAFDVAHRHSESSRDEDPGREEDEAIARIQPLPEGGWLLVTLVVPEIEETQDFLFITLSLVLVLLVATGLAGAVVLTRAVSRRLERVNALSNDIIMGDMDRRIPLEGSQDEFENLSRNLNAMLDRLKNVIEVNKQVTNDIAHDLRTPLTRIQAHIETIQSETASGTDLANRLEEIRRESESLLEIFNSLLRIAAIESGTTTKSFESIDLAEITEDVVELLEPLAFEKGIEIACKLNRPANIRGDRHLLFQALNNLIENAIKYSPEGAPLEVSIGIRNNSHVFFTVSDQGPGIPSEEKDKIFRRFYRLEQHRGTPGHGLGLSMVRVIADFHDAVIDVSSQAKGLKISMSFVQSDNQSD